jgi:pyruvate,water dikinase
MTNAEIKAPGPGSWQLDISHYSRPMTRFTQTWLPDAFREGQAKWLVRYGMPLKTLKLVPVDGFAYVQPEPLAGPPDAKPPPGWIFALAMRLAPPFRRCRKVAEAAVTHRHWRADAERWSEELWPAIEARVTALQDEDLAHLDDEALAGHVERAREVCLDSMRNHFFTNGATMIPAGMLLQAVERWSDVEPAAVLSALCGTSKLLGREQEMLDELRGLLTDELLDGEPGAVLEALRARDDEIGEAARAWLARVEHRQIWAGDCYLPTGAELPHLLVEQLRMKSAPRAHEDRVGAIRERIPVEHRARFDELVEEVRATIFLRDERCALADAWTIGVLRRALLEVGRRLEERGMVERVDHAVHLKPAEVRSLLTKGAGPDAETIAGYAEHQLRTTDEMPVFLGGEPPPMPPFERIPGALGVMASGLFTYVDAMEGDLERGEKHDLNGAGASPGEYIGVARIVSGAEDFARVKPGDVLVARATMPSYNGALAISGAVITDRGGTLSHAAIVSRELGIPAVVGTRVATKRIPDGARVRVNGDTGEVEVLE